MCLDHEPLDLVLERADLALRDEKKHESATSAHTRAIPPPPSPPLGGFQTHHQVAPLVRGDARGDDGPADATGAAERRLARHVHVGDVLVLAQQGQVQHDGERLGVGREDDELGDAAVQRLGGLVGALFDEARVRRLLDEVEDLGCGARGLVGVLWGVDHSEDEGER